MKYFIQKIGILLTVFFSSIHASAYDFQVDGIYYTKLNDGQSVQVSNKSTSTFAKSVYTGDIVIPSTVIYGDQTYNVTSVGKYAFFNSEVTSVRLPETITTIDNHAFARSKLMTQCNIPSNVSTLGKSAFSQCELLSDVTIPKNISILEHETFYKCSSITNIVIPKNVLNISYSSTVYKHNGALATSDGFPCFGECSSLKEVIIEDDNNPLSFVNTTPTLSASGALHANEIFANCPLEKVYIGRTLSDNAGGLFENFPTLRDVTFGEKVTGIQFYALKKCTGLTSVRIPDNVTKIGNSAFSGCTKLIDTYIGNGVVELPYGLWSGCTNLQEVFIGNNLQTIKSEVFNNCKNLKNIVICSSKLDNIVTNNIPSTVCFFLPKSIELLSDFTTNVIAEVTGGEYEYNGLEPNLRVISTLKDIQMHPIVKDNMINAGVYNDNISIVIEADNSWQSTFKTKAEYTITKAPLTVIANNASKQYGDVMPQLTCSFFGFKNGETEDVLDCLPNVETTAKEDSPVGTYPILTSGAEAKNYTFTYERGILTISKANQIIEWEQQFDAVNVNDIVELSAVSSSGLPVRYSITDESIAEVFTQNGKKYVEFLKPGKVSIRVYQDGDENYNEADRISKTITVNVLIKGITLDKSQLELTEDETYQLSSIIIPANSTNTSLEWTSSNPQIATVDDNGLVTAVTSGSTIITVRAKDGSDVSAECYVSISHKSAISDICDNNSEIDVISKDGIIFMTKSQDDIVEVFSLQGILLMRTTDSIIDSLNKGIYIIRIKGRNYKIFL